MIGLKLNKPLLAVFILILTGETMFPQSKAESIAKNGCLAMAYLYCAGIEDDIQLITSVAMAMDTDFIGSDCFVNDAEKYLQWITGRRFSVIKKEIKSVKELEELTDLTPVRYDYNGLYHWVVVKNGKIVFNSLSSSVCVTKGKPTTARIIKLKK